MQPVDHLYSVAVINVSDVQVVLLLDYIKAFYFPELGFLVVK